MSAICDAHKKVGVELLCNLVHRKFNQLEIRCGRENQHPERLGPPGPRLSSSVERERNTVVAIGVGVNMLQFCSVSNSLLHPTLSIKWKVYFSKELCRSSLFCRRYDLAACICVCIVGHGYTTHVIHNCYDIKYESSIVLATKGTKNQKILKYQFLFSLFSF